MKKHIALAYHDAYDEEDIALRISRSKIAYILVLAVTPFGIGLDYMIYPNLLFELGLNRFILMLFLGALLGLHYTKFAKSNIKILGIALALLVNISLSVMIYVSEGAMSPYYASLNLVILGAGVLMPWTLSETLLISLATIVMYVAACILHYITIEPTDDWNILFNNTYFIFLTGLISTTSSYFNTHARINAFNLRQELNVRNKELEALDRMKSEFFANISHELRTPLTLILSPVQDLLQNPNKLTNETATLLRTVRDNALRLLKLVNDLLEILKLEDGKSNLYLEPIELNNFLASNVDSMIHMAEPRKVTLKKELTAESLVVEADSYALERIFLNLLSNAIKFTSEGGTITVKSRKERGQAKVEIIDTGIGISQKDLPYIFDRFRQVDGSNTRKYQGTGLGLALVKDLTERLNGTVSVRSQLDVGTTMCVDFPLSQKKFTEQDIENMPDEGDLLEVIHRSAEFTAALPVDTPFAEEESELMDGDGSSVLIVDDEPDMRGYLVGVLSGDYNIIQARDGKKGLELARKYKPDIMLLDLMLPEMDGLTVCKLLKEDKETHAIKIILLTARADDNVKITALENGADDFLTKPFNKLEVLTRMKNLLQTAILEKNLVVQNRDLEKTLNNLKLTQSQLVQSEKLNSLGSLTAGLLHEINNPLNFSLTAMQVAMRDPSLKNNEDIQDTFSDIVDGMNRIKEIISDLHTFSHPSNIDNQKPFFFSDALESALRFTAHEHGDVLIKRELSDNDQVLGEQNHIIQVLINLLSNALRAVDTIKNERKGEITITSEQKNERLVVTVTDNGSGMDQETISRIFDPFFTTRDVGQGMGLGLSISHNIIKSHGGTLSVESNAGAGAKFTFDLALAN